jgi:hypothetical protein
MGSQYLRQCIFFTEPSCGKKYIWMGRTSNNSTGIFDINIAAKMAASALDTYSESSYKFIRILPCRKP